MSTQIIDSFKVNVAKPIDSRMVTNGQAERDALAYKYEGLRVYDLVDEKAYVYINGAWKDESGASSSGSGSGSSTPNSGILTGDQYRIPRFTAANIIGNSAILDASSSLTSPKIGIGMPPDSTFALKVKGIVYASNGFSGLGSGLTSLDGNNIQLGTINIDKLIPGPNGTGLKIINNVIQWASDINTNVVVQNDSTSTNNHYLIFSSDYNNSNGASLKANFHSTNRFLGIKPSTSQILASGDISNSEGFPTYTFMNNTDSGLFGGTTKVGLSFNSKKLLELNSLNLSIYDTSNNVVLSTSTNAVSFGSGVNNNPLIKVQTAGSATLPDYTWFGDTTTGMYRPGANQVSLTTGGVARFTVTNTSTTISNATILSSTLAVTGATTLSSTLLVTGAGTFNSSLNVTGTSNLATSNFSGAATFNSTFKLTSGAPGASKILTSDASGGGTWQTPPAGVPIGTIVLFWGTHSQGAPDGWIFCHGGTVNATTYPILHALLLAVTPTSGTVYAPDLRGLFVAGATNQANYGANGNNLYGTYTFKSTGGAETVTLNHLQIPKHTHAICDPGHVHPISQGGHCGNAQGVNQFAGGDSNNTSRNSLSNSTGISICSGDVTGVNKCGAGGQLHENRPPYMAIHYIIKAK